MVDKERDMNRPPWIGIATETPTNSNRKRSWKSKALAQAGASLQIKSTGQRAFHNVKCNGRAG
jgi:hypothetical protein